MISLATSAGGLQIIGSPAGAPKGYVDLRRAATNEHLGQGVQPLVASAVISREWLRRCIETRTSPRLRALRRIMELEADREQTLSTPGEPARQPSRTSSQPGRSVTR